MVEIITAMKCNETTHYTISNNYPISCKFNYSHILRVYPIIYMRNIQNQSVHRLTYMYAIELRILKLPLKVK